VDEIEETVRDTIGDADGGVPDLLTADVRRRARVIVETEDADPHEAVARATREVGKSWGTARRGDGSTVLMPMPPDRFLPGFDYGAAYAEAADAITALRGTPADPNTLELDPVPASAMRSRPSYFVRDGGALVYDTRTDSPTLGHPVVYELPEPQKPLGQGEIARAAMEYLTFRRQDLDGVQPELAARIEKIRDWRGAGGPGEAAATLAIEALSDGDPTMQELSALLGTAETQAMQAVTGVSGDPY
jgi:hypothetical protein